MKKIATLEEIPNKQAKSFSYTEKNTLLIYRYNDNAYAYINSCPHAGVSLEWNVDKFMSYDGFYLQCGTHGAQFEPATGRCIYGPCKGDKLHKVEIFVENDIIYLA